MTWLAIAFGAWILASACVGAALSRWFRYVRDNA